LTVVRVEVVFEKRKGKNVSEQQEFINAISNRVETLVGEKTMIKDGTQNCMMSSLITAKAFADSLAKDSWLQVERVEMWRTNGIEIFGPSYGYHAATLWSGFGYQFVIETNNYALEGVKVTEWNEFCEREGVELFETMCPRKAYRKWVKMASDERSLIPFSEIVLEKMAENGVTP
jgi:hypothetical protein